MLLGVAAGATTIALIHGAHGLTTPRPVATLRPAAAAGEGGAGGADRWIEVSSGIDLFASLTIDQRTLTPYGAFRGVEVWAAVDDLDNPCLVLVEEASQRTLEGVCTPHSGDLIADVDAWPRFGDDFARELAAGTVFRFQQRGTAIDAFVIEPSRAPLDSAEPCVLAPSGRPVGAIPRIQRGGTVNAVQRDAPRNTRHEIPSHDASR